MDCASSTHGFWGFTFKDNEIPVSIATTSSEQTTFTDTDNLLVKETTNGFKLYTNKELNNNADSVYLFTFPAINNNVARTNVPANPYNTEECTLNVIREIQGSASDT